MLELQNQNVFYHTFSPKAVEMAKWIERLPLKR